MLFGAGSSWSPGQGLWAPDLFISANLVLAGVLYAWGITRVRRAGMPWPARRTACFAIALVLLAFAYLGPPETLAHAFFAAHMAQHLIVMMLAAPFIVLSCPVALLVFATRGPTRRVIVRALRSRLAAFLVNPVFTWLLFAGTLVVTHITPVMEWTLGDHDVMAYFERPLYLIAALLFYYPLVGNDLCPRRPRPIVRVGSLALMMIPETVLGMVVFFAPVVLYPAYAESGAAFGHDPLSDQKLAGALMWALTMVIDSMWMMVAALEWWRSEERRTARLEREEKRATQENVAQEKT